jgi:ADP-heptose:LPS heptosyltransferase
LCLSLDKEPAPAALAMCIDAPDKRGIGLSAYGTPYPLNSECGHYFQLGLDDELKFRGNSKSYERLIYEAIGLPYHGQRARLYPDARQRAQAAQHWRKLGLHTGEIVVGLNTGAGRLFANKNWPAEKFVQLAQRLVGQNGWHVALLGGPDERATNAAIAEACPGAIDLGCDHSELDFAALVQRCDVLVTGDTMAMHVAIAADVPVVVLFGPTCAQEIDFYGRGEAIITQLACSPCYRRECDLCPNCMDDIAVERVLKAVQRWVVSGVKNPAAPVLVMETTA